MTIFIIIVGCIFYFFIGRLLAELAEDYGLIDFDYRFEEWEKGWAAAFFPIVIIYIIIRFIVQKISGTY